MRIPFDQFTRWSEDIHAAPRTPACYFLGQRRGCVVLVKYVGKAKDLRFRLRAQKYKEHPLMTHARWQLVPTYEHARDVENHFLEWYKPLLPWNKSGPSELGGYPPGTFSGGLPGHGKKR